MKRNLSSKTALVLVLVWTTFLLGCFAAPKNLSAPTDFMRKKGSIGIIYLSTEFSKGFSWAGDTPYKLDQRGELYGLGGAGILDVALYRGVLKELVDRLHEERLAPLVEKYYIKPFGDAFSHEGFDVKVIETVYDYEQLTKIDIEKVQTVKSTMAFPFNAVNDYDYKPISNELGTDYLLVLEVYCFGVGRSYFGFIPQGPPKGWTALTCTLVDTRSNKIISRQFETNLEVPRGEWDEPPEYRILMNAVVKSLETSLDNVYIAILKRAP
jgi:hypothetical protein